MNKRTAAECLKFRLLRSLTATISLKPEIIYKEHDDQPGGSFTLTYHLGALKFHMIIEDGDLCEALKTAGLIDSFSTSYSSGTFALVNSKRFKLNRIETLTDFIERMDFSKWKRLVIIHEYQKSLPGGKTLPFEDSLIYRNLCKN